MTLSASVLKGLIAANITSGSDPAPTNSAMVDAFADAIAKAVVQHITSAGVVVIPAGSIVTTGTADSQTGPAAPVPLQIT